MLALKREAAEALFNSIQFFPFFYEYIPSIKKWHEERGLLMSFLRAFVVITLVPHQSRVRREYWMMQNAPFVNI